MAKAVYFGKGAIGSQHRIYNLQGVHVHHDSSVDQNFTVPRETTPAIGLVQFAIVVAFQIAKIIAKVGTCPRMKILAFALIHLL